MKTCTCGTHLAEAYPHALCPPCMVWDGLQAALQPGWSVMDVGSGMAAYHGKLHALTDGNMALLDAHAPYMAAHKIPEGIVQYVGDLRRVLPTIRSCAFDAVLAIDLIEHLDKGDGIEALGEWKRIADQRVIVFTPEGFMPQDTDHYGLGAEHWQTHRSGWSVEDLANHGFKVTRWPDFHGPGQGALFAIW